MRIIAIFHAVVITMCLTFGTALAADKDQDLHNNIDKDKLTLCIHPYKSSTLLYRSFKPLVEYLAKKIGQPIGLHIAPNYGAHIDTVGANNLCIGYMGPAP